MIRLGLKGVVLSRKGGYLTIRSEVRTTHKVKLPNTKFTIGEEVFMSFDDKDNVIRVAPAVDHIEDSPEPKEELPEFMEENPELEETVFGSFSETDEWDVVEEN